MTYKVDVIEGEETLPVGLIYMEGFPSANRFSKLVDELVRTGMAHKAANFTIIKVKDLHFEIPLQGAYIRVEPYTGSRADILQNGSCPMFLKASWAQRVKHRMFFA